MANRRISPHAVEMVLKPSDRTVVCPDEDRCQLEMVRNDYSDIIQVMQDSNTLTQRVHIGLLGTNGGCDYACMVGLVQGGSPIAIGHGDGLWEIKLDGCIAPLNTIIDVAPQHLLCGRYIANDGERVVLIALQEESGGHWQVIVERTDCQEPLILKYTMASDGLRVSAALSLDLATLYVVESRSGSDGITAATWHRYVYTPMAGLWSRDAHGVVSVPPGAAHGTDRVWSVDRYGRLAGYWAATAETTTEQYVYPGTYCGASDTEITNWSKTYAHYTDLLGGYWDLTRNGSYVHGSVRLSPVAVAWGSNGRPDFYRVTESMSEGTTIITRRDTYTWNNRTIGAYSKKYLRSAVAIVNEALRFSATIGGASIGGRLNDYGRTMEFIAYNECNNWLEFRNEHGYPWQIFDSTIAFESWEHREGSRALSVTPGGWVQVVDSAAIRTPGDMSPIVTHTEAQLQSPNWGGWPCPDFYTELAASGMMDSTVVDKTLVWPVPIGSGRFSVRRSFTSFDQDSGEIVYGVMIQPLDAANAPIGAAQWHVYRNGRSIAMDLPDCTGHALDQLNAIYWRA